MRKDFDPAELTPAQFAMALKAVVVPRPIAWVATQSSDGVNNLAAFSFFTVASVRPPMVMFTCAQENDTLRNCRETGELVVNFSPESLFERINITGTDYPPEVDEFEAAGLTAEASDLVKVPRVAESPVAMECKVHQITDIGSGHQVFAEVLKMRVDPKVLVEVNGRLHPELTLLQPLARMGRNEWMKLGEIFDGPRWTPEENAEILAGLSK